MADRTGLKIVRVPLESLHLDPANARSHPERNMEAIRGSLSRFSQVEPLVVQKGTGRIIGGNGRYVAMKSMGWSEVDVVEIDATNLDATALGLALNRSAELAEWNEPTLAKLLAELRAEDGLDGVGFSGEEIDELLADLEHSLADAVEDQGPVEPPAVPLTREGDLWILGKHRLLCGDSTDAGQITRLMAGEKAALLATDPPYLVDYDAGNHPPSSVNRTQTANKRWDEYVDPPTSVAFFDSFLKACMPHCVPGVAVYQWHATRRQALVEEAWRLNNLLVHQTLVWRKSRGVLTRSHYLWQHEPCFYGWVQGSMPPKDRRPPCNETTVWEIDQAGEEKQPHPTVKPLEIFTRPIGYHTRAGEVCLEPFSGSGTQIIAAQTTGRRCFALELAPGFVDAAVMRWQKATGKDAILEGDGRSYEELTAERSVA